VAPTALWCSNASEIRVFIMHNAPPVAFPVGRFVWGRAAWLGMAVFCAVGLLIWQLLAQLSGARVFQAWAFWALCVGAAGVLIPRQALTGGRLFWSGDAWFWQTETGEDQGLELSVGLDLGSSLLLWVRLQDGQGRCNRPLACAWLSEGAMPTKWHGFRCAVYSRPKTTPAIETPMT
jgi:hypothetical protein